MEDLKKIINEVIEKNDKEWEKPVCEIVKKIIDLPEGVDTTIANLINYNPEKEIIDPLTQGKIANLVVNVCKKMNIGLVLTEDGFGGLAYSYHFKKDRVFSQDELKEFFYHPMNEKELEKIRKLGMDNIISQMVSYDYQIKYIENIGYLIIGEGYLILEDGTEPRLYSATIFKSEEEAKNGIMKEYNKSDDEIDEAAKDEWQKFVDECNAQDSTKALIEVDKMEYDTLKLFEKEYFDFFGYNDFVLKIRKGPRIPKENQNNDRIDIEIYNEEEYSIFIEGKKYDFASKETFNRIKAFISSKMDTLIDWSIKQNIENLDQNAFEGGMDRSIKVKYGNLIVNINGQVSDIGDLCDEFINEIKELIIGNKVLKNEKESDNNNSINLEVIEWKKLVPSYDKQYSYKGCNLFLQHDSHDGVDIIAIRGNNYLDIKDRNIVAGSIGDEEAEKVALITATEYIDEAILEYESKTDKDRIIDAMRLPDNINSLSRKEQNRILCENIRNINSKLGNSTNDLEYTLNKEQRTIKSSTMKNISNKQFIESYNQIIDLVDKREDTTELSNAEKVEVFTLIRMLYNNLLIEFEGEKLDEILYEKGNKYYLGKDVEKDYKKAFDIFKDLADNKEHLKSMEVLCYMYYYGQGTDINYELARKYCEIVEQKNSNCDKNIFQFLGEMYFDGLGVEKDYSKAKEYFEKSLRDKYDDTYYKLGLINSGNYGLPKDEEKAKEYFNKVEKDLLRAIIYLLIATKPEEEQNLEGVYNYIGNSRKEYNNFFTNSMPFDHIATINYKKVAYLNNKDYDNLVKNVKEKLEWCLHNDVNIEKGLFPFTSEADVDVYVDKIVNCHRKDNKESQGNNRNTILKFYRNYCIEEEGTAKLITYDRTEKEIFIEKGTILNIEGNNCNTKITIKNITDENVELEIEESNILTMESIKDGFINVKIEKGKSYEYVLPSTYELTIKII